MILTQNTSRNKIEKLNILQWNVQGVRAKQEELRSILSGSAISIACLQETLLGDTLYKGYRDYNIEKSPNIAGEGNRGVALLVHKTLPYTRININTTLEAVAISVPGNKRYTICSIYLSPNTNISRNQILDVLSQLPKPFLLLGDFNAKHARWDKLNPADQRGKILEKILVEEPIDILNSVAPTHYHIQTGSLSTIDLSLCSIEALTDFRWHIDEHLHSSDHYPIYLTSVDFIPQQSIPRWREKKANWEQFTALTDSIRTAPENSPIEQVGSVIANIQGAAKAAIPKSNGYFSTSPVPWWSNDCESAKNKRNKAEKAMNKKPNLANRMEYKRLRGICSRTYKDSKIKSWKSYVSSVNSASEISAVWKRVAKIKGKHSLAPTPSIIHNNTVIDKPAEVAEVFAQHFANICNSTASSNQREYQRSCEERRRRSFTKGEGHPDNHLLNAPFSFEEIKECLSGCKDSSPGPDDITIAMLKHLSKDSLKTLLHALNQLWETRQYPDDWRKDIKLPISKPNKDPRNVKSYRPISLTSNVCKLFERMVNNRLVWFLEKNRLLSPQQSGFRKNKSTMDSLSQLTSHVEQSFKDKKHTTAVFFDLEKAFDTVWRPEILISLHKMGLRGNLPCFISNFLTNRRSCVRIGSQHSEYVEQKEGVPQGSVLSVTCFAISINEITKILPNNVKCTLYVDDFAIYASAKKESHSNRLLQNTIIKLERWTRERGMKFSQEKTVAMKFNKRKRGSDPNLKLYNRQIKAVESTQYLGLVIDSRLSWKQHVEHLRQSCIPAMNLLRHLSHLAWGADRKTLLQLYTALVKSKLDYGSQIYGSVKTRILDRLDPIQNQCLRACTGAFKSSPAVSLCAESGVMPLSYTRDVICLKHLYKTLAQPDSLTHRELIGDDPQGNANPIGEKLHALVHQYALPTPTLWTITIPEKPPWKLLKIHICPFLEVGKQTSTLNDTKMAFLEHKEKHNGCHIYTDGSKRNGGVGYAAVLPSQTLSGKLRPEASIFTAELYAIKAAVESIIEEANPLKEYIIFSDSQSALQALKPSAYSSPLAQEIKLMIYRASSNNTQVSLCWVPAHCNILGNESADKAAKTAADSTVEGRLIAAKPIPHTDMTAIIRRAAKEKWQTYWQTADHRGGKLREIRRDTGLWSSSYQKRRKIETVLARLRIGHTNVTHSYLMEGQSDPPQCNRCNAAVTVKHLLVECRKYSHIRRKYYSNPTLSTMLEETKNFSLSKLVLYLQETDLFNKI